MKQKKCVGIPGAEQQASSKLSKPVASLHCPQILPPKEWHLCVNTESKLVPQLTAHSHRRMASVGPA